MKKKEVMLKMKSYHWGFYVRTRPRNNYIIPRKKYYKYFYDGDNLTMIT
jgi:hypothetical protein